MPRFASFPAAMSLAMSLEKVIYQAPAARDIQSTGRPLIRRRTRDFLGHNTLAEESIEIARGDCSGNLLGEHGVFNAIDFDNLA